MSATGFRLTLLSLNSFHICSNKFKHNLYYTLNTKSSRFIGTMTEASVSSVLNHRTIFIDHTRVKVSLPWTEDLRKYHKDGSFPLVEDPNETKKTLFIGMVVLRPVYKAWTADIIKHDDSIDFNSMYEVNDWGFNYKGLDGGGLIANGAAVDAYRLACQYGLSDAVLFGSNTVSTEGVTSPGSSFPGYLWQPYGPCSWGHIAAADPQLLEKILLNRAQWQSSGFLSSRKYPAQIICTTSGRHFPGSHDFLEARIFQERHPDTNEPIEVYILTSLSGAETIRNRAGKYNLQDRIDKMLIICSNIDRPDEIDYSAVPSRLFSEYDMKIVNHDGGKKVFRDFCRFGILSQFNITLCRNISMRELPRLQDTSAEEFERNKEIFIPSIPPKDFKPMCMITDEGANIAVVSFDCRGGFEF